MATPSFLREAANIKRYSQGLFVISENDTTTHLPTTFSWFERTKDSKFDSEPDEYAETDDTGSEVAYEDTDKSVIWSTQILARDEKARQIFLPSGNQSMVDKEYTIYSIGQKVKDSSGNTKYEFWIFPRAKLVRKFSYAIGSDGKLNVSFRMLKNDYGDLSVPMPTGLDTPEFPITTTGTQTVKDGDFYATMDLA
jgi:hypothetical protein